jgi:hypothetical protein
MVQGGSLWWWCGFNALVSAQEERRRDKMLLEDETEKRSHFGSMGKKRDTVRRRDNVGWRRCGTGEGKGRRRRQLG